ncbi:MAG: AraC family transcriptional regulator [Sphingomonas sp.]|nr:AraC family transcriptional regulator [Sphingomonas sp.]
MSSIMLSAPRATGGRDGRVKVEQRQPTPALRDIIRSFSERTARLGAASVSAPLPARPDPFIEFYLQDRYAVSHDGGPAQATPEVVFVGPQSYRGTRLTLSGEIHVLTIRFQPGGFHALFGMPMVELVDQGLAVTDVLGPRGTALRDVILSARDFDARIAAAEAWLADQLADAARPDRICALARALRRSGGRIAIQRLAAASGLGSRQFTRRFETQIGLTPKVFARTVRLNAVLDAKARYPTTAWTALVHDAGYADQAHFVRDCRELAGDAPGRFFAEWQQCR